MVRQRQSITGFFNKEPDHAYPVLDAPISPLRQRLIDDMNMRRFSRETQRNYLGDIGRLATFLGRSPDTATTDDLRRFQIEQQDDGVPVPRMNSIVSALRFFFTHTVDRPDLATGLRKSYEQMEVLKGIDFEMAAGQRSR
ncbi:phage integrase N-terminal SAM-like domain-containing protein [Mesorhizobium sp. WSM4313]|uniref:phage integrase N-terminal SAM-like domain-containing protein n=1 Tax=Mesorhizobium sp. WSM4313 TaxID=2029412 RepID=UPI001FD970E9|nr:phage integrase N-terminal SAM-like domain-containing protein [Mesorhizobium sp. WSM4313]